jgi:hypothetical protein
MDIGLNSDFYFELDDTNDAPLLTGREAFEQRLAVRATSYFHEVVGNVDQTNLVSLLKMRAERVAKDADSIDGAVQIQVSPSEDQPNTVEVMAIYETGDDYTFSLTE